MAKLYGREEPACGRGPWPADTGDFPRLRGHRVRARRPRCRPVPVAEVAAASRARAARGRHHRFRGWIVLVGRRRERRPSRPCSPHGGCTSTRRGTPTASHRSSSRSSASRRTSTSRKEPWSAVKLVVRPDPETAEEGSSASRRSSKRPRRCATRNGSIAITRRSQGALRDPRGEEERARQARGEGPDGRDARAARLVRMERRLPDDEVVLERDARRLLERGRRGLGVLWHQRTRPSSTSSQRASTCPTTSKRASPTPRHTPTARRPRQGWRMSRRHLRVVGGARLREERRRGDPPVEPVHWARVDDDRDLPRRHPRNDRLRVPHEVLCQWVTSRVGPTSTPPTGGKPPPTLSNPTRTVCRRGSRGQRSRQTRAWCSASTCSARSGSPERDGRRRIPGRRDACTSRSSRSAPA